MADSSTNQLVAGCLIVIVAILVALGVLAGAVMTKGCEDKPPAVWGPQ